MLCGHVFVSLRQLPRRGTDSNDQSGSEVVSHCGLNSIFPMVNDAEHLFQYAIIFIGSLYVFFGELFIQILCPFIKWVIDFFF